LKDQSIGHGSPLEDCGGKFFDKRHGQFVKDGSSKWLIFGFLP